MRKRTKKHYATTAKLLKSMVTHARTVRRITQLHTRYNFICRTMNEQHNKNPKWTEYKSLPITKLIKLMEWWQDQEETRKFAIQSSRSFCCPITGEILDMGDSFLIRNQIISSNGLESLIKKHGPDIIAGVNT